MSYYEPHSDPFPGARLTVSLETPPTKIPDENNIIMRSYAGPRTRLIVEGEREFVKRVADAMAQTVQEIRAEIEGAS